MKKYLQRYLYKDIMELALKRNKMAFISGPRQVGKTTLAKSYAKDFNEFSYKNWDETQFRRLWAKSPNSVQDDFKLEKVNNSRLLVIDEIHKSKGWKQKIKGIYDELSEAISIIVTGSARLNVFKKGGDSLMGRYLNFRLHPLSYGELIQSTILTPEEWLKKVLKKPLKALPEEPLSRLIEFNGFPEPYFSHSKKILNIWQRSRNEKIIREDLRDITKIVEISQVEMLASLLPGKVGSPLSVQSLREDLDVSHDTVTRWLKYLNELYFCFEVKPWSKSIPRSLKKEGKTYLYDWSEIENIGLRFENLMACHFLKACHYWTDTGEGNFQLHYLRNKEKEEIDFLISKNNKPWIFIEVKLNDTQVNHKTVDKFSNYLKCPYVQVVSQPGIWLLENGKLLISAHYFLEGLP